MPTAREWRTLDVMSGDCPVCDSDPTVLVAVRHPAMRRYIRELLSREHHCWTGAQLRPDEPLEMAVERVQPDLVIVDAVDFPECCRERVESFRGRVLVIGPEPDAAYRRAAALGGAGAWLAREDVADGLGPALRAVLGCSHDPCPPTVAEGGPTVRSARAGLAPGG